MRSVNFYRHPNGKSPVEEFLDSLAGKQAQKILRLLRRKLRWLFAVKKNI
jgi:hypothetical protein